MDFFQQYHVGNSLKSWQGPGIKKHNVNTHKRTEGNTETRDLKVQICEYVKWQRVCVGFCVNARI